MEFRETLPTELQSHPALADIQDVAGLATKFVEAHNFTQGDGWKGALVEEYRNNPSIAPIKDINSMVKSFLHAQSMVGANKVVIPGKNATKEEFDAFYAAIGRPESPEAYSIPKVEDQKSFDFQANKEFREAMWGLGVPDTAAKGIYDYLVKVAENEFKTMNDTMVAEKAKVETELKAEWGAAYQQNMAMALRLVDAFADEKAKEALKGELGSNQDLIRMFAKIGSMAMEDNALGLGGDRGGMMTPAEAKAKADGIKRDKTHPYHNASAPGHMEAVREMQSLYEMMYPEEPK